MRFTSLCLLGAALLITTGSSLLAQTGADLLIRPWSDDAKTVESRADALFLGDSHVKESGEDFSLARYEAEGRFRIIPGEVKSPRVGFDYKLLDMGSGISGVPDQLVDASVALGAGVLKQSGWIVAVKGGVGYAGSSPFSDGNAFYGLFDFVIGYEFDETSQFGFVLDYDGNRSNYRDVPIPGFAYRFWNERYGAQIAIGFPYSSIEIKPTSKWSIEAVYSVPDDLRLSTSYELIPHWSLFGSVSRTIDTFYLNTTEDVTDRLFFQQRRIEIGVQYSPYPMLEFRLAGGYAWDQEFSTGFSASNTDLVADVSDAPYVHIGVIWKN
jgi:hypothetical protein